MSRRKSGKLSKSDLIDGLILSEDIKIFNKNIKNILKSEIIDTNCLVSSMKFKSNKFVAEENDKKEIIKNYLAKTIDNKFAKIVI